MMNTKFKLIVAAITIIMVSSCASVVNGPNKNVIINTNPSGAVVTVVKPGNDLVGSVLESRITPAVINLKRGNGPFNAADYLLLFHKDGYMDDQVELHSTFNGIYLGNLIIGGPIGLLIDPITGAMWDLPDVVNFNLTPLKYLK